MIISNILDNDLYKFTMMQAAFFKFPNTKVKYEFKDRNGNLKIPLSKMPGFLEELVLNIRSLRDLTISIDDLSYLKSLGFFYEPFINYLANKEPLLNTSKVSCKIDESENLRIAYEGNWLDTILLEVPILAIVSELYHKYNDKIFDDVLQKEIDERIAEKEKFCMEHSDFKFADFGTRRRFSLAHHERMISRFSSLSSSPLFGTSNLYLAKKYNLTPIGTMAHEWIQAMQGKTNILNSQKYALQSWADVYRGDLGIALSDCLGMDKFLEDFDMYFGKLFDGCRHDSGSPFVWAHDLIDHYEKMGIDPKTKTAVFSDGLTFESGLKLIRNFKDKINVSLGIGTYFSNNVSDLIKPPNIVLKMVECDEQPVAKLSDAPGKCMCNDENYIKFLRRLFNM